MLYIINSEIAQILSTAIVVVARLQDYVRNGDIICLNEIKTPLDVDLAGYTSWTSGGTDRHRGGCALY